MFRHHQRHRLHHTACVTPKKKNRCSMLLLLSYTSRVLISNTYVQTCAITISFFFHNNSSKEPVVMLPSTRKRFFEPVSSTYQVIRYIMFPFRSSFCQTPPQTILTSTHTVRTFSCTCLHIAFLQNMHTEHQTKDSSCSAEKESFAEPSEKDSQVL